MQSGSAGLSGDAHAPCRGHGGPTWASSARSGSRRTGSGGASRQPTAPVAAPRTRTPTLLLRPYSLKQRLTQRAAGLATYCWQL